MLKLTGIFAVVLFLLSMRRIFKYGNIQNISLTPDKELNIVIIILNVFFICMLLSTRVIHFLKTVRFFWPTLHL